MKLFILELIICGLLLIPVGLNAFIPIYVVQGNSMEPFYHHGNVVLVHNWPTQDPQTLIGKIIVYFNPDSRKIIIHRVIAAKGKSFITKGDHNAKPDIFKPTAENILGVVWVNLPL